MVFVLLCEDSCFVGNAKTCKRGQGQNISWEKLSYNVCGFCFKGAHYLVREKDSHTHEYDGDNSLKRVEIQPFGH